MKPNWSYITQEFIGCSLFLKSKKKTLKGFKEVDGIMKNVVFKGKNELECTKCRRKQKVVIDSRYISAIIGTVL